MKLHKFCAKCGKIFEPNDKIFQGFLCQKCSGQEEPNVDFPNTMQLRQCVDCGAVSIRLDDKESPWQYIPPGELHLDYLSRLFYEQLLFKMEEKESVKCDLFFDDQIDFSQEKDIVGQVEIRKEEDSPPFAYPFTLNIRKIHCIHCAQKSGGRFDAIVQIRIQHSRDEERLPKILADIKEIERQENVHNLSQFIAKIEDTTNGVNLMVSSNAMGRALVNKLRPLYPFEIKHSSKLMGLDIETGAKMYRQSTLLRLVPVIVGDHLLLEGEHYRVKKITRNKVVLQKIPDDKVMQINFDTFQKKKWKFLSYQAE